MAGALLATVVACGQTAVPARSFGAGTTGQLLEACTAPSGDPSHGEAMQFCRGFVLGVLARQRDDGSRCTLSPDWRQTLAGYAAWAHANPIHLDDDPARSVVEFLDLHGRCSG
ncbi:Rap1a/Tai family immunity protein [Falsiroseomonas tokyonensis]|nr:Rap1a/Tai family immunity protein [Falsiroseomonas tokyonensis]